MHRVGVCLMKMGILLHIQSLQSGTPCQCLESHAAAHLSLRCIETDQRFRLRIASTDVSILSRRFMLGRAVCTRYVNVVVLVDSGAATGIMTTVARQRSQST